MSINNLAQLKREIAKKREFRIIDHFRTDMIGQLRQPNVIQTNGFYSIRPDAPDSDESKANRGNGYWLDYGKAAHWTFDGDRCSLYNNAEKTSLIFSFEFLQETTESEN